MNNNVFSDLVNNATVRIAVVGVLGILALFLLAQTIAVAENFGRGGAPATDTITVTGQGQATIAPDVARLTFTVQNTKPTVSDAQSATTRQANAALAYLKEQKIDEKDVKTLSYTIYPQYAYPSPCPMGSICPVSDNTPRITGYKVAQTVQVTVRDLSQVGTLIGGLGKLEVQNLNGPDFALDDPTMGMTAARADAIAKARAEASVLAKQLGVRLGDIVNFSESSGYYYPMMYGRGGAMAEDAKGMPTPSVPTGQNTYNATVSITYEIR